MGKEDSLIKKFSLWWAFTSLVPEVDKMKKIIVLVVVLVAVLATTILASAGGMTKVENWYSGRAWYGATGNGIVHERFFCDENWENCIGNWINYPVTKFVEPPECDDAYGPVGPIVILDVGDGSDILKPGEYWFCWKTEDFRVKGE